MTDEKLVRQAKAGDRAAFESLVKKYESRVAATVIGMLGSCQAADDVGQEVFIRLFKYLANFKEDASLATYITRIAINLSLNELKRRKRRHFLFSGTDPEDGEATQHPDETLYRSEEQRLVHRAIQRLEPEFRAVLVLRLIEGHSTQETADILGIPQGTVLSRLSRAQKKMKSYLTPFVQEEL